MDKSTSDPLRNTSNWITLAESAAERKRKETEPKRIFGAILLSGLLAGIVGISTVSWEGFAFCWMVLGVWFAGLACDEKEGPQT